MRNAWQFFGCAANVAFNTRERVARIFRGGSRGMNALLLPVSKKIPCHACARQGIFLVALCRKNYQLTLPPNCSVRGVLYCEVILPNEEPELIVGAE